MSELLFIGLALVVAVVGFLARRERRPRGLSDDLIRQIETTGRVDAEDAEGVDLEQVRAEEDAFWQQTWDDPEEL